MSNLAVSELLSLLDLTCLTPNAQPDDIKTLCHNASGSHYSVAAVCVGPEYVELAARLVSREVAVATVVNFPDGGGSIEHSIDQVNTARQFGATEIDVVMPYQHLLKKDTLFVLEYLTQIRLASRDLVLKVILETGALDQAQIRQAAEMCVLAEANFIKTSTGTLAPGATIEAVDTIMSVIAADNRLWCGIKVSGGVATVAEAQTFLRCIQRHCGIDWVRPAHVRIGASRLLQDLLRHLP